MQGHCHVAASTQLVHFHSNPSHPHIYPPMYSFPIFLSYTYMLPSNPLDGWQLGRSKFNSCQSCVKTEESLRVWGPTQTGFPDSLLTGINAVNNVWKRCGGVLFACTGRNRDTPEFFFAQRRDGINPSSFSSLHQETATEPRRRESKNALNLKLQSSGSFLVMPPWKSLKVSPLYPC